MTLPCGELEMFPQHQPFVSWQGERQQHIVGFHRYFVTWQGEKTGALRLQIQTQGPATGG